MDVVKVVYSVILLVVGLFIFIAPMIQKGDERKRFIYSKAQSYAFMVVIGMLLLEVAKSIFLTTQGNNSDKGFGISPIMFLTVISVIYLVTLLIYRKNMVIKLQNHIRELRKSIKLSQEELAKRCKVSRQTINAIENDKYDPTLQLAFDIASVLNTTVDELFVSQPKKK